jgi:hypothetical protein
LIPARRRRSKRQDGQVPERPTAIKRLDALFSAAMIAHEAIFEMRRELIASDRGDAEQARLLEESAQIVTGKLPGLTARVRQLSGKWAEQSVLHPERAEETLAEVEAELEQVEPEVQSLLHRQREIAARLRLMLEP